MATSNQDTNIKDVAAPASASPTNIGHVLGLNAAKTQDVLIPLSMLRQVIAQELKTALSAITSGSPDVPVFNGGNLSYMTLANFAKVVGEQVESITGSLDLNEYTTTGLYNISANDASQVNNLPALVAGLLEVKPIFAKSRFQIYYTYEPNNRIFIRRYTGSTWNSWRQIGLS